MQEMNVTDASDGTELLTCTADNALLLMVPPWQQGTETWRLGRRPS